MLFDLFFIILMIMILILYIKRYYDEITFTASSIDGRRYIVRKLPDRQKAADILARINRDNLKLINHMAKISKNESSMRLKKNYNPDALSEGGTEIGYTSYSVNKGEKIILCLRQSDLSFVKYNTLLYVSIHELAHLMTKEIGHPKVFWENFKNLVNESVNIGIYKRVDFAKKPESYCGITISSSV